jgi:hypothetical protein
MADRTAIAQGVLHNLRTQQIVTISRVLLKQAGLADSFLRVDGSMQYIDTGFGRWCDQHGLRATSSGPEGVDVQLEWRA